MMLYKSVPQARTPSARLDRSMPGLVPLVDCSVNAAPPKFEFAVGEFRHAPQSFYSRSLSTEMNTPLGLNDIENNPKGLVVDVKSRAFHLGQKIEHPAKVVLSVVVS